MSPLAVWETPTINALAETINDLYKSELIYSQTWEGLTDVEWATLCWVHWWNTTHLHSELDYHPHKNSKGSDVIYGVTV